MSELLKITITAAGAILVYVVGRIIEKFFIEPRHNLFLLKGEIADSLIFFANYYCNPGSGDPNKIDEASRVLRQQASQLIARSHVIPLYGLWRFFGLVPKYENILLASKNLMGLSNSIYDGEPLRNSEMREEVEKRLSLRTNNK